MTPSLNYNEVYLNIETELRSLQIEKERLQQQQHSIEQRLGTIYLHEAKLQRVVDSLADLLPAVNDLAESNSADSEVIAADAAESVTAADTESVLTQTSNQPAKSAAVVAEPESAVMQLTETIEQKSPAEKLTETITSADDFTLPELKNVDLATFSTEAVASSSSSSETNILQIADFDARAFFQRFPHITNTHPVHLLAGKLLEYFGYGLKLAEIARLIESTGYKHNSRNFTDSVHSALKNKRKATGEFRFNANKSVWELSQWQSNDLIVSNARAEETAEKTLAKNRNAPATALTRQVETAIAKQLSKAKSEKIETSSSQTAIAPTPAQVPPNSSSKKGSNGKNPIKVYKPQR